MPHNPTDIDRRVGEAIRAWRLARGMRLVELARRLGISYQQVQKIERGENRVTAGRLYTIARALGTSPDSFYDGLVLDGAAAERVDESALTLVRLYTAIADPDLRRALIEVAKRMQRASVGPRR
jgi:transcriptional regulator with XRE-family HTH domain